MKKIRKFLKNKWKLIEIVAIIIVIPFIFRWLFQLSSITLGQKRYVCFPLPKDDRSNLTALSIMVSGFTDTRDMSMKRYEKKLSNSQDPSFLYLPYPLLVIRFQ